MTKYESYMGYFLKNELQTSPPPKKEIADDRIFLAYVSDDFRTNFLFNFFF